MENIADRHHTKNIKLIWLVVGIGICALAAVGLEIVYSWVYFQAALQPVPFRSLGRLAAFFIFSYFIFLHFIIQPKAIYRFIYKYRFALALAAFVFCVVLQLHGSSMGMWNGYFASSDDPSTFQEPIFGMTRAIRSDEWNVFTPLSMSQGFNNYEIMNPIARAWPTDMLTIYNQPVWDITLIAKPFYWGYLLLGPSYGLAWFWSGRMIALFLVTFELSMVLTKGKKGYSAATAFLVAFAPMVQWWFAINFLVEMLVAGQLAILMIYHFMNTNHLLKKGIYAFVFALCALAYIFALYPAWMIPLIYLFAALAVWVIVTNFKNGKRRKAEWLYILGALVVVGGIAVFWFLRSKEAFELTMNTVYPGRRVYTGGDVKELLFAYTSNLITPYLPTGNPCEGAMVFGFFPLTEIIALVYLIKRKFKDLLVVLLLLLDAVFLFFAVVGFPEGLAKATLLSNTTVRIVPIIGLIEIFIYIKILSSTDEPLVRKPWLKGIFIAIGIAISCMAVYITAQNLEPIMLPSDGAPVVYWVIFAAIMSIFMAMFFVKRTTKIRIAFTVFLCILAFISGVFVNPVMRTTDAIYDKPLAQEVQKLQQENPGIWIATDQYSNFLIANGAPTITSTNIFPALERWEKLDPNREYADIYNRYAHIILSFTEEETSFGNGPAGDTFVLELNPNDLFTLDVDYICTTPETEIPTTEFKGILRAIYEDETAKIYRVEPQPL